MQRLKHFFLLACSGLLLLACSESTTLKISEVQIISHEGESYSTDSVKDLLSLVLKDEPASAKGLTASVEKVFPQKGEAFMAIRSTILQKDNTRETITIPLSIQDGEYQLTTAVK